MSEMLYIGDAPQDRPILLRVSSTADFVGGWWVGHWSVVGECWVVRTPLMIHGKHLDVSGFDVQGWAELPER